MAKFRCKWHIKHNGEKYAPGDEIELTAKEAKPLLHALEKVKEEIPKPGKADKK